MLEFMRQNWWMFLIGGLIMVGAIVGVIFGARTKGNWTDHGFMKTDTGASIRWSPTSQLLILFRRDLSQMYINALFEATSYIHRVVGRRLFMDVQMAPDGYDFDQPSSDSGVITVVDDDGDDPNHGITDYATELNGLMLRASITLPEAATDKAYPIVLYELLHALGLEHDEGKSSIMYPKLQDRPQELSEADQQLLKKQYG